MARVNEWREAKYLSQRQLVDKAGISRVTIIDTETGKPMQVSTVQVLAALFGIGPPESFRLPEETRGERK